MRSVLPQLQLNLPKEQPHKQTGFNKMAATPKINIKGITLKDYFRIYHQAYQQDSTQQNLIYQPQSPRSSSPETPTFNQPQTKRNIRIKIKTDITDIFDGSGRPTMGKHNNQTTTKSTNMVHCASNDKNNNFFHYREHNPFKKKQARKKMLTHLYCSTNRSQDAGQKNGEDYNRLCVLPKMQGERQRAYNSKSNAHSLSKYSSKLHLDTKTLNARQ